MLRLNDINNFIEVSSASSFSMAARKLEVTQPALSESIKRLEKDLQVKLFYRAKAGISLTPEGKRSLEKAKNIQNLLYSLGEQKEEFSPVTLGCHPAIGSFFLPKFFRLMDQAAPGHKIQLKHDLSRNIQADIQTGTIDIGIVVNPLKNPDLVIKPFAHDNVRVWKAKNKKAQEKIIADTDLFQVQSILKSWKKTPTNIIHTSSFDLIGRMVNEGCGYGIIPERAVKLLKLNLTTVPGSPVFKDTFNIVYRPEFGKSDYETRVIRLVLESFS